MLLTQCDMLKAMGDIRGYLFRICFASFVGCIVFVPDSGRAQSLSFSQVLLINNVEDTVPAGKVWKIESILTDNLMQYNGSSSGCSQGIDEKRLFINGAMKYIQSEGLLYSSWNFYGSRSFPFWLPAGTRLRTDCPETLLSVIEFTVTP